jgi:hypothetical protein
MIYRAIKTLQEITVKRITTQTSSVYIIPESIHLKECRLEDGNTLLFFSSPRLEWKRSCLSANPLLMDSGAVAPWRASLTSRRGNNVFDLE